MTILRPTIGSIALFVVGIAGVPAGAQPGGGAYTEEQAAAGQAVYEQSCAACHGIELAGSGQAPELTGSAFMQVWGERTTSEMFAHIKRQMPPGGGGVAIGSGVHRHRGLCAAPQRPTAGRSAAAG